MRQKERVRHSIGKPLERTVSTGEQVLTYELTRKAVKNINLRVGADGVVRVSAAARVPLSRIDTFVASQAGFIARARQRLTEWAKHEDRIFSYEDGAVFTVLGRTTTLRIETVLRRRETGWYHDVRAGEVWLYVLCDDDRDKRRRILDLFWRDLGQRIYGPLVTEAVEDMRRRGYAGPMPELRMRRMKSRWGSCMPSKPWITLNTRLLEGPIEFCRYVAVHEAAHLLRADHSPAFHALVADVLPQWPQLKKDLHQYFRDKPML